MRSFDFRNLNWPHTQCTVVWVIGFKHHFIITNRKMLVEQVHPETVKAPVLLQYFRNIRKTFLVTYREERNLTKVREWIGL
ncbi:MAG: hypothetical protein Q7S11_01895 [bacterium]|nr:hypothetical protein [bacterium]